MKTDEELLQAYAGGGDRTALDELFERHRRGTYLAARRILRNDADALDATQAAFLSALRHLDSLRAGSKFGGWLRRIAVNEALGMRRSHRSEAVLEGIGDARPADAPPAADEVEILKRSIDDLPEDYRLPIVLHYCDGLSYDEIARVLEWPRGTVGTNIHRGMERLRTALSATGLSVAALLRTLGSPPEAPPSPGDSMLAR